MGAYSNGFRDAFNKHQRETWTPKLPLRYSDAKWSDIPPSIQSAFDDSKRTKKGFYIYGGVGSGKTHAAYALYRNALRVSDNIPKFWNTTELFRELRLDVSRQDCDKRMVEIELMNCPGILFLDDVGAEKISDWVLETFYLIINKRYNDMLPIIFTSNYNIADLSERLGDRIVSRIVESCNIVKLDGNDRRLDTSD